ncbi:MAG: class I SAM-dependent methyltransferase [Pseudomonadota bacterium]|nr:class I SAM-dependent methyltransferase [Pseudomonadota bacterium]
MLRVVDTHCIQCSTATPEKVLADKLIRTLPENDVFGGKLRIVECSKCGLRYLNPTPDVRDLGEIYNYDVYEDSTNNNPVLMEHFYQTLTRYVPKPQRLIEIGCGTGDFLAWLQAKGIPNVEGVEFADSANRVKYDGPLHVGRMEDIDLPDASYDVVLLLNVIEHLSDPQAVLVKIRRMLKPGGVLLLRHPNSDLFFFKPYWLCVEVPKYLMHRRLAKRGKRTGFTIAGFQNQHLFYFHRRAIGRMLGAAGMQMQHFSTTDPYNRLRIGKSLKKGKFVEAGIASLRHALGAVGLGPECLSVATVGTSSRSR